MKKYKYEISAILTTFITYLILNIIVSDSPMLNIFLTIPFILIFYTNLNDIRDSFSITIPTLLIGVAIKAIYPNIYGIIILLISGLIYFIGVYFYSYIKRIYTEKKKAL